MRVVGACLVVCVLCYSVRDAVGLFENGQWMWIDGSSSANAQSKVNATNKQYPGARHGATAWTDVYGRVWMYGGEAKPTKIPKKLDELWIYDPKSKRWLYVGASGANTTWPVPCVDCASCSNGHQAIIFGGVTKRKGVSHFHTWVLNMTTKKWSLVKNSSPTPREKSTYWCDQDKGMLWLYGGVHRSEDLQDMWQFSFLTIKWTEIHIPQNLSSPRERFPAVSWVKHDDKLFLFGGTSALGLMSDLWMFSTSSKKWKLLKGDSNKHSQSGIYGHRGIPSNVSMPGCRSEAASWSDSQGNLWMFGGKGCDKQRNNDSTVGLLSDLWMYNTSSSEWTWIGGSSRKNGKAFYGKKGEASPQNMPGPREASLTFRQGNNFWIFGGLGRDESNQEGPLNDMWVYSDIPFGPPSKSNGLPGDTLDMPYTQRLLIAFGILIVAMIVSLYVCYRKECNIMYWRYKKKSPRVKYEPLKVKMQVPDV